MIAEIIARLGDLTVSGAAILHGFNPDPTEGFASE
jgi:hypothetical protein